jgi:hypothetical protein
MMNDTYKTIKAGKGTRIQGELIDHFGAVNGRVAWAYGEDQYAVFERQADGSWAIVPPVQMCECEMDWRCGLHKGQPTYLETRYSELDLDPRERSDYVGF